MKKSLKNLLLLGLVSLAAGMFTACSDSSDDSPNVTPPIDEHNGYVPVTLPDGLAARPLTGIVKDTEGKGISGVTVKTGSVSVKTNAAGLFVLEQVWAKGNRIVVSTLIRQAHGKFRSSPRVSPAAALLNISAARQTRTSPSERRRSYCPPTASRTRPRVATIRAMSMPT